MHWWKWWSNLQPEWREKSPQGIVVCNHEISGNWASLKVGGKNGIVTVMMSLGWWGAVAKGDSAEWIAAVEDVTFALRGCLQK
jgi:hypothetical protein